MSPSASAEAHPERAPRTIETSLRGPVRARVLRLAAAAGNAPLAAGAGLLMLMWSHSLFGFGGPAMEELISRWVYNALLALAVLACFATSLTRQDRRLISSALGIGLLSFLAGGVIYSAAPDLAEVPIPSVSDPLWLAIYPFEYVALLALTRQRVGRTLLATRLDGLLGGLAVAAVVACVSVPAAAESAAGAGFWERATLLAYPVADLILLGAVVSAVGLAGWRIDRVWGTLAAAILAWVAADLMFLLEDGDLTGVADGLVMTGALGLAAATRVRPRWRGGAPGDGNGGLFAPVGFGLLALTVLLLSTPLRLTGVAVGLAGASLGLALVRMAIALRENGALLTTSRIEATTDALTGLRNRRKLTLDLAEVLADGPESAPHLLVLLDLNGFKAYNDGFGHGAGDELLARLGAELASQVGGRGVAYRMGGDEFCVLAPALSDAAGFAARCARALSAQGAGSAVTAACGTVLIPAESHDVSTALALADRRMYHDKNSGQPASGGRVNRAGR